MRSSPDFTFVLVMYAKIRRAQYGEWRNTTYRRAKHEFKRQHFTNICGICHKRMKKYEMNLDHIIPLTICYQYDLPQLEFDHRNFRWTHRQCNLERGIMKLTDLPVAWQNTILRTYNRNKSSLAAPNNEQYAKATEPHAVSVV